MLMELDGLERGDLGVCTDDQCMAVLTYFQERDADAAQLGALASFIARRSGLDEYQAKLMLHHNAIPKLEERELVEYDARSREVSWVRSPPE